MPAFRRYIGIDYSGAATADSSLSGLRLYMAEDTDAPLEILPPRSPRKYWTRRGIAAWLKEQLAEGVPALVGIDHGMSFPLAYFEAHDLPRNWDTFLDDFHRHWPADQVSVEDIRTGHAGNGADRSGDARWRRLTEQRSKRAKSVFHFDVQGSVAKSTHAGLPWLWQIRRANPAVHVWPFDGWTIPAGRSAIAEVYPSIWSGSYERGDRTPDQHDAFCIAARLSEADQSGELVSLLTPDLTDGECTQAQIEGWILGVK